MPGRVHSREFKLLICRQITNGEKRPAQICREHSLDQSVLSRWRREYQQHGEDNAFLARQPVEVSPVEVSPVEASPVEASPVEALERRIADLERHCGRLSLENDLLKKLLSQL